MVCDPEKIFADLAEIERVKGHHSPEGRAIRTLGRALNGWTTGFLSIADVFVLCDQAMADWLAARMDETAWSARSLPDLAEEAVEMKLIEPSDATRLREMHRSRTRLRAGAGHVPPIGAETTLRFCIQLVERHW